MSRITLVGFFVKINGCVCLIRLLALVYYAMAASTGVEVANFNLAYLCEGNYVSQILTTTITIIVFFIRIVIKWPSVL